jgi:uncharacterized damage-inducible protein DinB
MIQIAPDRARFLFEFLLPQLQSEHAATVRILSSVPPDMGDFRPAPRSMSALELARHISVVEIWFLDAIIHQGFEEVTPLSNNVKTCQDVAEWYAENFVRRIALLEQLSSDDLATLVDFNGLRKYPAVAYLNIAIRHSVHHRGQLASYLRPMGAKVPAIYVESADEPFPPVNGSSLEVDQSPPLF